MRKSLGFVASLGWAFISATTAGQEPPRDVVVPVQRFESGTGVTSLNGLQGDIRLQAGSDLSLVTSSQTLTLSVNSSSSNIANALVRRDGSGKFSAGTITGSIVGAASLNVLKAGDTMSGDLVLFPGNLNLTASSGASGNILKGGTWFIHDFGTFNTFVGNNAGNFTMTGGANTGIGFLALLNLSSGSGNTASGNTALAGNTTGNNNTATGNQALEGNAAGSGNTASGAQALSANSGGGYNTATGTSALYKNVSGDYNTACGGFALLGNTTGSRNTALGYESGADLTTGGDNIDIGNRGAAAESATIRIGDPAVHVATFVAGINGATSATGVAVYVNANGQLGTLTSSARFKRDIRDLGDASEGMFRLRPVSFRYTAEIDPSGLEQFGLVAEEVADVYPELVTRDDGDRPQAIRYHMLVPMLLNELQKLNRRAQEERDRMESGQSLIAKQQALIDRQAVELETLKGRLERLEARLFGREKK